MICVKGANLVVAAPRRNSEARLEYPARAREAHSRPPRLQRLLHASGVSKDACRGCRPLAALPSSDVEGTGGFGDPGVLRLRDGTVHQNLRMIAEERHGIQLSLLIFKAGLTCNLEFC